jgi:hypothetical protein
MRRRYASTLRGHWAIGPSSSGIAGAEGIATGRRELPDRRDGPMYRGPRPSATGPFRHYVFEIHALDTTLDMKLSGDAFETGTESDRRDSGPHPGGGCVWADCSEDRSNDLAALGRLWPHRQHESNWLKALLCAAGFHRWHTLTLTFSPMALPFDFCRWCSEVRRARYPH